MGKYITEETMKRIQVANSLSGRLFRRRLWIDLACNLAICYHYYNATRIAGAASDVASVHDLALDRELQLVDDRGVGETTARSLRDFFILHPPCIASICQCV